MTLCHLTSVKRQPIRLHCVRCNATFRALNRAGVAYTVADITEIPMSDRKNTRGEWAGDSDPAGRAEPGDVVPVWVLGSGGGFEGDPVAHGGELGDVVADLSFGGDAVGVVVGAEVVEAGGGVGE